MLNLNILLTLIYQILPKLAKLGILLDVCSCHGYSLPLMSVGHFFREMLTAGLLKFQHKQEGVVFNMDQSAMIISLHMWNAVRVACAINYVGSLGCKLHKQVLDSQLPFYSTFHFHTSRTTIKSYIAWSSLLFFKDDPACQIPDLWLVFLWQHYCTLRHWAFRNKGCFYFVCCQNLKYKMAVSTY